MLTLDTRFMILRKFIKDKLGDEVYKLSGAINTMLNMALIAAMGWVVVNVDQEEKRPRRPRRFDPKKVRDRARNIQRIRRSLGCSKSREDLHLLLMLEEV